MTDGRSRSRPGVDVQRDVVATAAIELFLERGSGPVSISKICEAAGVSRPTFYRCFPDKDALLAHLYARAVHDHTQVNLDALVAGTDPREALDAMFDRVVEHPRLAAFLFAEASDPRTPAASIVEAAHGEAVERIEAMYDEGAPSRTTLRATLVACQWIVHDAIRRGLTDEVRSEAKEALWELTSGVFRR